MNRYLDTPPPHPHPHSPPYPLPSFLLRTILHTAINKTKYISHTYIPLYPYSHPYFSLPSVLSLHTSKSITQEPIQYNTRVGRSCCNILSHCAPNKYKFFLYFRAILLLLYVRAGVIIFDSNKRISAITTWMLKAIVRCHICYNFVRIRRGAE